MTTIDRPAETGSPPLAPTSTGQEVAANPWLPFVGKYEKQFYEVRSPETGHVIQHMWPNAGRLHSTDGKGETAITAAMGMQFRLCTCGHKYGGCLQPEVRQ